MGIYTRTAGDGGKSDPRAHGPIKCVGWHHVAGFDLAGTVAMMGDPAGRGVSANGVIGGLEIVNVVHDDRRAFTTGSPDDGGRGAYLDHISLTVEVVNRSSAWDFTADTLESCARYAAAAHDEYGVPLVLAPEYGAPGHWLHGPAHEAWGAGYATVCPGQLRHLLASTVLPRARQLVGANPTNGDPHMLLFRITDHQPKPGAIYLLRPDGRHSHMQSTSAVAKLRAAGVTQTDVTWVEYVSIRDAIRRAI